MRTAQNFDAFDIGHRQTRKVEFTVRVFADRHAIDQHEYMIGFGATDADLRLVAEGARARHRKSGHLTQHVRDIGRAAQCNLIPIDHGIGPPDFILFKRGQATGIDDELGEDRFLSRNGKGYRQSGSQQGDGRGERLETHSSWLSRWRDGSGGSVNASRA